MTGLLVFCCTSPAPPYKVEHRGALQTLIHEGDLRAVVALDTLQNLPHLFALGAVENLKGEILIYNSQVLVASVQDSGLTIARDFNHKASLLVYAQTRNWQKSEVPPAVLNLADFETFLLQTAKQNGLRIDEPLPFRIEGTAAFVDWHVIDWPEADTVHTHEKHRSAGRHGRLQHEDVEILGFYSNQHQGVFTHRNSNMHLHVKTASGNLTGHVDDLELHSGIYLYLPK